MYFVLFTVMWDIDVFCFVYIHVRYQYILFCLHSCVISIYFVYVCGILVYFVLFMFVGYQCFVLFTFVGYQCVLFCLRLWDISVFCFVYVYVGY